MKAIVLHSVVPVRAEAMETAAMETELLFAETCTVLEKQPRWLRVRNDADGQEGWVDSKMITLLSGEEQKKVKTYSKVAMVRMPMAFALSENNGQTIPLSIGTRLPNYRDGQFELLGVRFRIDSAMVLTQPFVMSETNLCQAVRFLINTPYLWGGKNALGMDCSGFVQIVHSLFGYALPRNASEQAMKGRQVTQLKNAQAGDLAFFDHQEGRISHVGILIDTSRIIHCSGRVKVEKVDDQGIWNMEEGKYSHHLVKIRRIRG